MNYRTHSNHYGRHFINSVPSHIRKKLWFRTLVSSHRSKQTNKWKKYKERMNAICLPNKKVAQRVTRQKLKSRNVTNKSSEIKYSKGKIFKQDSVIPQKIDFNASSSDEEEPISDPKRSKLDTSYAKICEINEPKKIIQHDDFVETVQCSSFDSYQCPFDFNHHMEKEKRNFFFSPERNLEHVTTKYKSNKNNSTYLHQQKKTKDNIQHKKRYVNVIDCSNSISSLCPVNLRHSESSDSDSSTIPLSILKYTHTLEMNHEETSVISIEEKSHASLEDELSSDESDDSYFTISGQSHDDEDNASCNSTTDISEKETKDSQQIVKSVKKVVSFYIPKNQILLILHHPAEVVIKGIVRLKALKESVTVYGYQLDCTKPSVCIYSLHKFGYITICTNPPEPSLSWKTNIADKLEGIQTDLFSQVKSFLTKDAIVVLLKPQKLLKRRIEFAMSIMGRPILPSSKKNRNQNNDDNKFGVFAITVNTNLACSVDINRHYLAMLINEAIYFSQQQKEETSRIIVCGGKDSGKSTLLRFLMNNAINLGSVCYHLEGDVGQTEFTPPGCISLTCIDTPILGPPFTHIKNPERMCFLGAVSVSVPDDYLSIFEDTFQYYTEHHSDIPLFVNTMGWTKALGLSLLIDIIHIVQPTHIVQINIEDVEKGHNFPSLTPKFAFETEGWKYTKSSKVQLNYSLIEIPSLSHTGTKSTKPPLYRSLAMLSYLGQLQSDFTFECMPINSFTPYVVPWSDVSLHVCNHDVPPDQILCVFNASWVALCKVNEAEVSQMDENEIILPKILSSFQKNMCIGFGIVRGIDPIKQLFYIITPEPLEKLQMVNALIKGSVDLPEELLKSQKIKNIPYVNAKHQIE